MLLAAVSHRFHLATLQLANVITVIDIRMCTTAMKNIIVCIWCMAFTLTNDSYDLSSQIAWLACPSMPIMSLQQYFVLSHIGPPAPPSFLEDIISMPMASRNLCLLLPPSLGPGAGFVGAGPGTALGEDIGPGAGFVHELYLNMAQVCLPNKSERT